MTNRIIRSFHRLGVAVAVFVLLAGGCWAMAAALFSRGVGDSAIIGIGVVATVVLALAAWGFYCVLAGS
jgi:hypothetical protein